MLMLWFLMSFRERRRVDRFGPGRDLWRAPWLAASARRMMRVAHARSARRMFRRSRRAIEVTRPVRLVRCRGTLRGKPRAVRLLVGD